MQHGTLDAGRCTLDAGRWTTLAVCIGHLVPLPTHSTQYTVHSPQSQHSRPSQQKFQLHLTARTAPSCVLRNPSPSRENSLLRLGPARRSASASVCPCTHRQPSKRVETRRQPLSTACGTTPPTAPARDLRPSAAPLPFKVAVTHTHWNTFDLIPLHGREAFFPPVCSLGPSSNCKIAATPRLRESKPEPHI